MSPSPTTREICGIADQALYALLTYNLRCCLFGSAASWLHGLDRTPNDVDLVVFTTQYSQEELKEILVCHNRNFYLAPAVTPGAHWKVLWYSLPQRRRCKVDVLLPDNPNLKIPIVPEAHIEWCGPWRLPRMPLIPLLLVKLQGWRARRNEGKEPVDAQDVYLLLQLALGRSQNLYEKSLEWFCKDRAFMNQATCWIEEYIEEYPKTTEAWRRLGFFVGWTRHADEVDVEGD